MKQRLGSLLLAAFIFGAGYFFHDAVRWYQDVSGPVVVTKERMYEITRSRCLKKFSTNSRLIQIVEKVFDDPHTPFLDMDLKPANAGDGCSFEYVLAGDSVIQGIAVVRLDDVLSVRRIDFFNWIDARLMKHDEPSFSLFFFDDGIRDYVFSTLSNKLFEIDENNKRNIRVSELKYGMTNSVSAPKN